LPLSRTTPAAIGKYQEQFIQTIINKDYKLGIGVKQNLVSQRVTRINWRAESGKGKQQVATYVLSSKKDNTQQLASISTNAKELQSPLKIRG
jgi:hypothetical protein